MKVLLLQLDGKLPNIALMRIAAHHRDLGDEVDLSRIADPAAIARPLFDQVEYDKVYASVIFMKNRPLVDRVFSVYPSAVVGGTGYDLTTTLEGAGISTLDQDYSIYPGWSSSIGFSQRGCRRRCPFCVVPEKEGAMQENLSIAQIWRGEPWPREILLLDNDFFGQPHWRERIAELRDGKFKVSFNQGINARALNDETAAAVASVDYRDERMKAKRVYTAWDHPKDEDRVFRGLQALVDNGVRPYHILVYMIIGYWPGETHEDRDYRRRRLREFGALPYPMLYAPSSELLGFQRWVIGAYDVDRRSHRATSWEEWTGARWQPTNLDLQRDALKSVKLFG